MKNVVRITFLSVLLYASHVMADPHLIGKVVGVSDGDTVTILDANNNQHNIRMFAIDAPETSCYFKTPSPRDELCIEKSQPFGKASKKNLSRLIFGKTVTVVQGQGKSYGRIVGTIFLGNQDINLQQVRDGYAWHYTYFARNQDKQTRRVYEESQRLAKQEYRGLWGDKNPVAPWDYRKNGKGNR